MPPSISDLPAYFWEVPEKPVSVHLHYDVIDRMSPEIMRGLGALKRRGAEVGGLLLGKLEPGTPQNVVVEDFEPIPSEYLTGPSYSLSPNDLVAFEAAIARRRTDGKSVVGFYRSHTRDGLFLADSDVVLANRYFRDPSNVILLIRPFATRTGIGGFFIWENGEINRESSYQQFPFSRIELGGGELRSAKMQRPAPPPVSTPIARQELPAPPRRDPPPAPLQQRHDPLPPARPREDPAPPLQLKRADALPPRQDPAPSPPLRQGTAPAPPPAVQLRADPIPKRADPPVTQVRPDPPDPPPAVLPQQFRDLPLPPRRNTESPREPVFAREETRISDGESPLSIFSYEEEPVSSMPSWKWVLVPAFICLAGIGAFFGYRALVDSKSSVASQPAVASVLPLKLSVAEKQDQLDITWDRNAPSIGQAIQGVLTITDGPNKRDLTLSPAQLKNGRVRYRRLSGDVALRLEVFPEGQEGVSESIRIVLAEPAPSGPGAGSAEPVVTESDAAKPEAVKSEAVKSDPPKPDATKSESVKPAADKTEAANTDAAATQKAPPRSVRPSTPKAERRRPTPPTSVAPAPPVVEQPPAAPPEVELQRPERRR